MAGQITHAYKGKNLTPAEYADSNSHLDSQGNVVALSRSASLIVAASDASDKSKAGADYVCDGTADNVEIQAAIDALPAGGKVLLSEGTFNINARIDVSSNTMLQGIGWGTKLVVVPATFTSNHSVIRFSSIANSTVRDLLIDGEWDNGRVNNDHGVEVTASTDCLVENVYVMQVRGQGFLTSASSTRITFSKCWAYKVEHRGFNIGDSSDHILVSDSYAIDCTLSGYLVGSTGVGSTYVKFVNCITYNPTVVNTSSHFIAEADCDYVEWINCGSHTSGDSGFALMADYGQATNCLARDAAQNGFRIGGDYNTITNFVSIANTSNGVQAEGDNNRVMGGIAESNGVYGIRVYNATLNLIQGTTCKNNSQTAGGTRDGIEIYGATSLYNIITDNHCYDDQGAGETQRYGIAEANGADSNVITNNDVRGNITAQMLIIGASTIVRNNQGYVTENSGSATLLNGQTTIVVAHGLSATPTVINICFKENPTNAIGDWWVDTVGATNFTFNGVDPGASNLDFYWEAKVR